MRSILNFLKFYTFLLLSFTFIWSAEIYLENVIIDSTSSGSLDVMMVNDQEVGGFQFVLEGDGTIIAVDGGDAADNGFTVSGNK